MHGLVTPQGAQLMTLSALDFEMLTKEDHIILALVACCHHCEQLRFYEETVAC